MNNKIFLTGFMGSGKSRIGKILAKKLGIEFIDTDDIIESRYHISITQIFQEFGEEKFRESETEILNTLTQSETETVIALGGGTLIDQQNIKKVKQSGYLIYIQSSLEQTWERVKHKTKRPLLLIDGRAATKSEFMDKAQSLFARRQPGYEQADFIVNRDGKEAEEVVDVILKNMRKSISILSKMELDK